MMAHSNKAKSEISNRSSANLRDVGTRDAFESWPWDALARVLKFKFGRADTRLAQRFK